jgi:Spy/CpxP family protein refolding chaperone
MCFKPNEFSYCQICEKLNSKTNQRYKMINTLKKVLLAILITAFVSPSAFSQHGEGWNLKRLESKLNLTDAQKNQIEKLQLDHQKAMVDFKANLEKAKIESKEVTRKDDFTRNEYLAAHNKMVKLREDIQLAAANHRMDVLELMNKDQRKILAEERKFERRKHQSGRKGRGSCDFNCQNNHERKRNHW